MWTTYRVRLDFVSRLYGQTPADPNMIDAWLKARQPKVKPPGSLSHEELTADVLSRLAEGEGAPDQDYQMLVFVTHPPGRALAMRSDTFRSHLKDCARILSVQFWPKVEGERAFSTRFKNAVYTDPKMPFTAICRADGTSVAEPDGFVDRPVHTWQGNSLKRIAYVNEARMDFQLLVLEGHSVRESDVLKVLTYGGVHGYAGERSLDGGKYTFTLERLEGAAEAEHGDSGQAAVEDGDGQRSERVAGVAGERPTQRRGGRQKR